MASTKVFLCFLENWLHTQFAVASQSILNGTQTTIQHAARFRYVQYTTPQGATLAAEMTDPNPKGSPTKVLL